MTFSLQLPYPEKNSYDMGYQDHVPHMFKSVRVSQYFANFFVDEGEQVNLLSTMLAGHVLDQASYRSPRKLGY
jgi:hypothetical protein